MKHNLCWRKNVGLNCEKCCQKCFARWRINSAIQVDIICPTDSWRRSLCAGTQDDEFGKALTRTIKAHSSEN